MKRRRVTREASTVTSSTGVDESFGDDDGEYGTTAAQRKPKGGNRKSKSSISKAGTLRIPPTKPRIPIAESVSPEDSFSLLPLFDALGGEHGLSGDETGVPFEDVVEEQLPDIYEARKRYLEGTAETNQWNHILRPLVGVDNSTFMARLQAIRTAEPSRFDALLERKVKLNNLRHKINKTTGNSVSPSLNAKVEESAAPKPDRIIPTPVPDPNVVKALELIGTTPFDSSFASRILGSSSTDSRNEFIFRDWEASTQWLDLMDDIHAFAALAYPERDRVERLVHPIDYQHLRPVHLPQLHDLLSRTFWPGINVEEALQFSPERCTIVATYQHVVVGAALLSSPNETYITYLAVRSGWEGSQIATKMLYLLLQQSPQQDVILHVSANNPAMLLYNRFGFKAEEFIVGFYEEYLDRDSRASKNAFRLRLRR